MIRDELWAHPKPRCRGIIDDRYDEIYIVDERGWDVDPALLREEEDEE